MRSFTLLCYSMIFTFVLNGQQGPAKFGIDLNDNAVLGGLSVGDTAPEIKASIGEQSFILSEALKDHEVLIIFYRGYWCGVCNKYLSEFEEDLVQLTERGIRVIAITPEQHEYVDVMRERTGLSVDVISDADGQIMRDYKVFYEVTSDINERLNEYIGGDLAAINGQDRAALPVPATYLIGKNRKVRFAHYDVNYRNRATVEDVLSVIK